MHTQLLCVCICSTFVNSIMKCEPEFCGCVVSRLILHQYDWNGWVVISKKDTHQFSVNCKLFLLWSWFCSGIVRAMVGVCVDAKWMVYTWPDVWLMYRGDPMSSGLSEWWIVYPVFCTLQPFCLGHCQLDKRSNKMKTNVSFGGVHFVLFFISVALEGSSLSPKQKPLWGWVLPGNIILTCLLPAWNRIVSAQFDMLSDLMLSEPMSHLWYFVISMVFSLLPQQCIETLVDWA